MSNEFKGVVPYLFYDDAEAAIEWYTRVFGFTELSRWTNDQGLIQNAEMSIGSTELWLDGSGRRQDNDARPTWIGVWVESVNTIYERVKNADVECDPPIDRDFGVRMFNVGDGMGHLWGFIRRIQQPD